MMILITIIIATIIAATFLCSISCTKFQVSGKKVLVIGGTGRVGRTLVEQLVGHGFDTSVLSRNPESLTSDPIYSRCTIHNGDVNDMDSILRASKDCNTIISLQAPRPRRYPKLSDLWNHPKEDKNHPYSVNFLGVKRILAAMTINKVSKLIRITGALTDKNAFSPFVFLFNLLSSFRIKWNELSEIDIRRNGVDYTVIRPSDILDSFQSSSSNLTTPTTPNVLHVHSADNVSSNPTLKLPFKAITVADLSSLIVHAIQDDRLKKTTLLVSSAPGGIGATTWDQAITASNLRPDTKALQRRNHDLAFSLYSTLLLSSVYFIFSNIFRFLWRGKPYFV